MTATVFIPVLAAVDASRSATGATCARTGAPTKVNNIAESAIHAAAAFKP
jgi:hypothetical protein